MAQNYLRLHIWALHLWIDEIDPWILIYNDNEVEVEVRIFFKARKKQILKCHTESWQWMLNLRPSLLTVFMYVCMYVCMCMYVCVCMCACVWVRVCVCVCEHMHSIKSTPFISLSSFLPLSLSPSISSSLHLPKPGSLVQNVWEKKQFVSAVIGFRGWVNWMLEILGKQNCLQSISRVTLRLKAKFIRQFFVSKYLKKNN